MYKVYSVFDKDKVIKMNKGIEKSSILTSVALCIVLFILGVVTLILGLTEEKVNWLSIVIGAVACVFSVFPLIGSITTAKKGLENAIKQMGVETSTLKIEYVIKEKRIEVKQFKGDNVIEDTIMFKNVASLKKTKDGICFYLENGLMYYFEYNDVVVGTVDQILSVFKRNGIKIPK